MAKHKKKKSKQARKPRLISNSYTDVQIDYLGELREQGLKWPTIAKKFNKEFKCKKKKTPETLRIAYINNRDYKYSPKYESPRVLILDIETKPMMADIWGLWNQNIGINQLHQNGAIMSWSAKWLGASESEIMYEDNRHAPDYEDDSAILGTMWDLLDQADIVITHNGLRFDIPWLNARFTNHGYEPPSTFRQIDTLKIAKKNFRFPSNKLAYLTDKLCVKYKKLSHGNFPGQSLWTECLKGNMEAWAEMEEYNRYDVLSLEELYLVLAPWDRQINFNVYHDDDEFTCKCGSKEFRKSGFHTTGAGRYQKYKCKNCGHETRDVENLLGKQKRKSMRRELR